MKKVLLMLACGVMFLLTSCGGGIESDAQKLIDLENKVENCKGDDCSDLMKELKAFNEEIDKKYSSPEDKKAFMEAYDKLGK